MSLQHWCEYIPFVAYIIIKIDLAV